MATSFLPKFSISLARLNAVNRVSIGLVVGILSYFIVRLSGVKPITGIMIAWDIFSCCLIGMCWFIFFNVPKTKMGMLAQREDESRTVIFFIVLVSVLISLFGILLMGTVQEKYITKNIHEIVSMLGVGLSWFLLHTIFTLHYAHQYYDDDDQKKGVSSKGINFPDEDNPDYLDFAYFSFVLGMTFQVSDVTISAQKIRRLALLHGIIAFLYNTIIVALTINIIAGLKK
ncbi:MAG: DUF1345 domain-containing protein [Chitinophagaceae bacterium]